MLCIWKKKSLQEKNKKKICLFFSFCIPATATDYKIFLGPNYYSLVRVKATISKLIEKIENYIVFDPRVEK